MKKIIICIALAIFFLPALAQESTFNKGDNVINLGIGIGSLYGVGTGYSTTIPPVSVSFERGFFDGIIDKGVIGIGGFVGYTSYKWENVVFGDEYGYKYTNIIVGARGTFHYPLVDKLDTYAGVFVGYNIVSASSYGTFSGTVKADGGNVAHSEFIGVRYYFTDKFSAMAEVGYGISYLTLGLGIKF